MINQIHLTNFKSARNLNLPLRSLTVLSGLNGSGKSTVLQGIALVKQTLDSSEMPDGLPLRGDLVKFGKSEDVHYENADSSDLTISVCVDGAELTFVSEAKEDADILNLQLVGDHATVRERLNCWFQFIQADRLTPAPYYEQASTFDRERDWLGCGGEFTVDFLERNQSRKVPANRRIRPERDGISEEHLRNIGSSVPNLPEQTAAWMQLLSPGVRFKTEPIKSTDITTLGYQYTGSATDAPSKLRRTSAVGFGLTYSLPIIVACLAAEPGAILLIENPEAHLHPRGQAALGTLLARCATGGVQIIVETHSDHVLNGIRVAVKKDEDVKAEDIALFYFTRDLDSGETTFESPKILPDGQLDSWPAGFFDQWDKSLDNLLD